jgi:hypothetical protein
LTDFLKKKKNALRKDFLSTPCSLRYIPKRLMYFLLTRNRVLFQKFCGGFLMSNAIQPLTQMSGASA